MKHRYLGKMAENDFAPGLSEKMPVENEACGKEPKEDPPVPSRCFALYAYNFQRDERFSENESIVSDDSQSEKNFSLSVLSTNLDATVETELRKYISQKLTKGLVYSETGSISQMEYRSDDDVKTTFSCYFCMLEHAEEKELLVTGSDLDLRQRKYIVCFLSPPSNVLDHFQQELDVYSNKLVKYLDKQVCSDQLVQQGQESSQDKIKLTNIDTSVRTHLENWYETTMDYTCRCVKLLKQSVKYILYGSLIDAQYKFEGMSEQQIEDIQMFMKACNLSEILKQSEQKKREASPSSTGSMDLLVDLGEYNAPPQQTLTLRLEDGIVSCTPDSSTEFCNDWSVVLNKTNRECASAIQNILVAFKVKYTQSINTLKRLLIQAETDYYALYKSYVFLKNSGNCDILLHYGHLDSIPEVQGVIKSLKEFIQEKVQG